MKKIISMALVLVFVLALASCGVSVKGFSDKVDIDEFYEELKGELKLDDEDRFDEAFELTYTAKATESVKTQYDGGKKTTEKSEESREVSMKFDGDEIAYVKGTQKESLSSPEEKGSYEEKQEAYLMQDGDDFLVFDQLTMTYVEQKDMELMATAIRSYIENMLDESFDGVISDKHLSAEDDLISGIIGGIVDPEAAVGLSDDAKIKYYIDDNIFTAAYEEKIDNEYDDYEEDGTREIIVQIIIEKEKIVVVRTCVANYTCEYDEYVETVSESYESELVISFKDVNVKEPDEKKYTKLEDSIW